MNISVQSVKINNCICIKGRKKKDYSLYSDCKLFLSENWFKAVKVNYNMASIPLFRVDIPLSSESIYFGAKISRIKLDDKIEL